MRNPFRTKPRGEPVADPVGHDDANTLSPRGEPVADPVGHDDANTLSQIRRLTVDDERPTREDRGYGATIFTRPPVALPRLLTGKRRSTRR